MEQFFTIVDSTDGKFKGHQVSPDQISLGNKLILDEDDGTHFELLIDQIKMTFDATIVGNANYLITIR
jgi:hypothetical protein